MSDHQILKGPHAMKKPVLNIEVALALVEKTDDPAKLHIIRDNAAKAGVAAIVDAADAKLAVNSGLRRRATDGSG